MADRQQFNVSLPPELVRRVKHRAVDDQLSLSDLVERVLAAHLDRPGVVLAPTVHVEDVAAAVDFSPPSGRGSATGAATATSPG